MPRPRDPQRRRSHRPRRLAARHGRPGDARASPRAAGGRAGGAHLGPREHRVGRARDQDGRVRFRREAPVARQNGARRQQRDAAAPARGREPGAAGARRSHADNGGRELCDASAARAGGDGGADQRPRADLRRERHGKGAGRPQHSSDEPQADRSVHRGELRGHPGGADRKRAVRPRPRRLHGRGRRPPR